MPLIAYPSVNFGRHPDEASDTIMTFPVDGTRLVFETPGRIVHENAETRDVVVINRGPTLWMLTLTFGQMETETPLFREFERWLSRMHDLRNYAPVPLGTRTRTATLVNSGITVNGKSGRTLTLSAGLLEAGNVAPPLGVFLRIGDRLGMLESVSADGLQISVSPDVGAVGDSVSVATTMLARLSGNGSYRVDTSGGLSAPLTVPFQEALA